MADSMPPFNETARCPKCDHAEVKTTYVRADESRRYRYSSRTPDGEPREHLRRVCARCRYEWNEAPIGPKETANG